MKQVILIPISLARDLFKMQCQQPNNAVAPHDLTYYEKRLSDKLGWKLQKTRNYLNVMYDVSPMAVISILAKEIAIVFDKNYENHISECEEVYVISNVDGKIHKVLKKDIISYRTFACFRTEKDALKAREILSELYADAFGK